jgi:hypothetical protein
MVVSMVCLNGCRIFIAALPNGIRSSRGAVKREPTSDPTYGTKAPVPVARIASLCLPKRKRSLVQINVKRCHMAWDNFYKIFRRTLDACLRLIG